MKVISFNSYKGGSCRTTTCYNTLPYLAKALGATSQEPILVYDIDLDSMGLTNMFHKGGDSQKELPYSAKHLFVEDDEGINQNAFRKLDSVETGEEYFKHYEKVGNDLGLEDDGSVLFLGADKNSSTISDDDYVKYAESSPIQRFITKTFPEMQPAPKAVVFDCASGVQGTTLTALRLTNCAVMCMRPTYQSRVGTSDYLTRKIPLEINRRKTNRKREIILLPTAVAQINMPESEPDYEKAVNKLNDMRQKAIELIRRDIIDKYKTLGKHVDLGYELNTVMFEDRDDPVVGIPEIERFKWEETLLYKMKDEEKIEQERQLEKRYEKLAALLAR
ncbi:MAG: hypothetical protein K2O04_03075 [Clostridiales bacterium]|nr:hypothetical protein [Clostridiales bacterium]